MNNYKPVIGVLGLCLIISMPLQADGNEALYELLNALHENGTIDEETYRAIRQVAERDERQQNNQAREVTRAEVQKQVAEQTRKAEQRASRDKQPTINTRGKFEVTSADEDFSFRVGGRIQADAAIHDQDLADHGNGSEIRRGRLFASGTLWRVWDYKFQYDFTGSASGGIADAYLAYNAPAGVRVQGGHFKEPFSLQNMTSSKYINFIERGLPHLFVPGRNIGLEFSSGSDHWSAAAGVFGSGIDSPSGGDDEGMGVTGRATYAPINDGDQVLHFGGALSYRDTGQAGTTRFSSRHESHITDIRQVDTRNMGIDLQADDFYRYGLEAAWVHDRLTLQGEYMGVELNGNGAQPDAGFDGYYAEVLWFLTDDQRSYSGSGGAFKSVRPNSIVGKGGIGAWQVGARFSNVDLNDGAINGGEADNMTLGLNWFPNANLRFSANYIRVLDTDGGPVAGDEPDIFTVRGQVEF
ncbi:phosphate-selective porin OprO/OprP [Methylohalomonas lacus]|uniref:Phosphate-selective porin OprO/OprP n=1 Tax=Methylohalomonas lacus TaxID=398773 RepID=A0AAE3HLP5_9GAMM|nr:OprO/OprP family phosphate-selective porin [Methylohalomonas lacus]MCS3904635.1 phosphate-selective porin OprO/OprP [Methylohalomonas lacus]